MKKAFVLTSQYIGAMENMHDIYLFNNIDNAREKLEEMKNEWIMEHLSDKTLIETEEKDYFLSEIDSLETERLELSISEEKFCD